MILGSGLQSPGTGADNLGPALSCHVLAMWGWANHLNFLCLSCPIWKTETTVVLIELSRHLDDLIHSPVPGTE